MGADSRNLGHILISKQLSVPKKKKKKKKRKEKKQLLELLKKI